MKLKLLHLIFILPFFIHTIINAQPVAAGDIAFLGFNADNTDQFTIIVTNYLEDGTIIYFSDAGWNGAGFYASEGHIQWNVPAGGLPGGTMVTFTGGTVGGFTLFGTGNLESGANVSSGTIVATASTSSMALSTSGDAILAYIGSTAVPTFIACVNFNGAWTFAGANLAEQSLLPPGLSAGATCVLLPDRDNQIIDCLLLPDPAVAADYNTAAYWIYNDATRYTLPPVIGTCDFVLPIVLKDFYLINLSSAVQLNWKTSTEINSAEFIVEKSAEGETFYPIGNITAAGNTTNQQLYTFTDDVFSGITSYYRLKLVDLDGSFQHSAVIVSNIMTNNTISIFPNPVEENLFITTSGFTSEIIGIEIINTSGQKFRLAANDLILSDYQIKVHLQNLPTGIYTMNILYKSTNTVLQFIKL